MEIALSWIYLFFAIFFGVFGSVCMKMSQGLKQWKPTVSLFIFYFIAFVCMTLALRGIDVSIVYAIWSGLGTVLIVIIGYFVFEESISLSKFISLILIVLGVLGIHLTNAFH